MLPEKRVPSSIIWTVCRWCLDCAAGPEESFRSEVQRLHKFCSVTTENTASTLQCSVRSVFRH